MAAVDVARTFTKLKLSLMPYLFQTGLQPHLNGTPVMRSMFVEFPDDQTCRTLDRQYIFSLNLLVAPVFTYSGDVEYYLPAGVWTNWFTGEKVAYEHGVWRNERHGFDTIPLWVREGSVLVTKPGPRSRIASMARTRWRQCSSIRVTPLKRWLRRQTDRRWCSALVRLQTVLKCPARTDERSPHVWDSGRSWPLRKAR